MDADEIFESIIKEMMDKFLEENPDLATELGLHEPYDYLLPKGSTEHQLENVQLLQKTIERIDNALKREDLNDQHRIDLKALENAYEQWSFRFYEQRIHELNPDAFSELGEVLFLMLSRDYAPLEKRVDAMASRIQKAPRFLEEFRSRFKNSRPVRLWTQIALETAQNMEEFFQFVLYATKDKIPATTHDRLAKALENLQPALRQHTGWLNDLLSEESQITEEWALGQRKFEELIQLRKLGISSDEILRLGFEYLDKFKAERKRMAQEIAPGKSDEEVLETIESRAPRTFEEAIEYTRKTMEEARTFIREKNIVTVYPEDRLEVVETPAFLAPILPFAAMMMPAKYDKPQTGIYVVTRPKDTTNLGKHLNYSSIRNTAVHEAFPGHFLQATLSNRGSIVQLLAQGAETIEGWAHYCEQMMAEKGFIKDRETRIIQINDMIWRAVRIIVDVKLSRGEMSFNDAVAMLMQEARMSKEGAEAEVKRYTQTPGYALSYLLGKHMMLKLKDDLKRRMGEEFDDRFFHDTVAANGYLPMYLVQKVFDQKLKKLEAS
jgi:uncharacterized protein (DUF885 family)